WLKNNRELINVATSRARDRLILLSSLADIERLHTEKEDDLYELVKYVRTNGETKVSARKSNSRALGVKPFSTQTEEAFLQSLTHALENIWLNVAAFSVKREVPVAQVFQENITGSDLFYTGRFDFVICERQGKSEIPVLAIELDGKEHYEDEAVRLRDAKKELICRKHHLQLIRVENSYARRYHYIKSILIDFFQHAK
ncbi:MAG: DUF2726 domain-containing protein, partial [Lachnospiraceae bacterium]|nr:DUF2726 domain-containing protein [Lachnospiraceae bacterium]